MHPLSIVAATNLTFQFDVDFFLKFVFQPSSALIGGVAITLYASVIAQAMGVILGIFSALAGMSRNRLIRFVSGIYVWFFRGTPVLIQMSLVYFGTPYLLGGIDLFPNHVLLGPLDVKGALVAGIVALGVNEGAYMSEIVRAGILSVDPGQTEAAKSLGMTYRLTMSRIVLPQALRVIIPPLGNEFNNMLKTTSLMAVISVQELYLVAENANSATFKSFEAFFGAALYYLALTTIWTFIQSGIEARVGRGTRTTERVSLRDRLLGFRVGTGRGGPAGTLGGH